MSAREETPLTSEHFAQWCLRMTGHPYWYGTCGYRATEALLRKKRSRYPKYYPARLDAKFRRDIAAGEVVADCVGACKGYAWTGGGAAILAAIGQKGSIPQRYQANGCPDKGADSMLDWARKQGAPWGTVDRLPDVPGLCLHKKGHVGYTVGGGWAVEWRGTQWGCVRTRISDRPWTEWFALPFLDYGEALPALRRVAARPTLRRGAAGEAVRTLQATLNTHGAGLTEDGRFGKLTEAAVRAFQRANGLAADGVCGAMTWRKLLETVPARNITHAPVKFEL